ncbi:hypothetical protein BH23CHL4_BH23CHL4_28200 [soil metagenome]
MGTGEWEIGNEHWALGTGHWELGTGHWALGTGHWALVERTRVAAPPALPPAVSVRKGFREFGSAMGDDQKQPLQHRPLLPGFETLRVQPNCGFAMRQYCNPGGEVPEGSDDGIPAGCAVETD